MLTSIEAILTFTCEVTTAASGEEALALLEHTAFDVVCTDYKLGGAATGLDVLARARSLPHYVGTVLFTGDGNITDGAGSYLLMKPFLPERLLEVVDRAGAQSVLRRSAAATAAEWKRKTGEVVRPLQTPPQSVKPGKRDPEG